MATKEQIIARRQVATERYILSTRPVLYLPFYRLDGTTFRSKDGYGHLATVTEALPTPQGRKFDATNDKIAIPHHTALNGGAGLTVAIWYKSDDLTVTRNFLVKNDAVTLTNSYLFRYDAPPTDTLQFRVNDGTTTSTANPAPSLSTGIWYCLMGIKNGTSVSVLKNGTNLQTATTAGLGSVTVVGELWVGGDPRNGAGEMAGLSGEACVWDYALSFPEARRYVLWTKWRYQ